MAKIRLNNASRLIDFPEANLKMGFWDVRNVMRKDKYLRYGGKRPPPSIFSVRTTVGQERNVASLIESRVESDEELRREIKAILVPEPLSGYLCVEATGPQFVDMATKGIKHLKQTPPVKVSLSEVERYIIMKPVVEELDEEDIVEIVGGPFKDMKARVMRVDKAKGEVTLELLEATFTLPITIHADYVKLVEKSKKGE